MNVKGCYQSTAAEIKYRNNEHVLLVEFKIALAANSCLYKQCKMRSNRSKTKK
jgi:hypothetical protein